MLISQTDISSVWLEQVVAFRHALHTRPCLAGNEAEVVSQITDFLQSYAPDRIISLVDGTGVAVVFAGNRPGKRLLLRADTDSLPINEINTFYHKSVRSGISHKCGHDGHTAMLAGVAPFLSGRNFSGEVVLLFQPAEEVGRGAAAIIADPDFNSITPDFVAGLHNLPGFPAGTICLRDGVFAAASEGITIHLKGKTAHAAYPETGLSPALAMAQLLTGFEGIKNPVSKYDDFHLVTVVHARLGTPAFGTAPGEAVIAATLRTFNNQGIDSLKNRLLTLAHEVAARHGLTAEVQFNEPFRATESHSSMVAAASRAAKEAGLPVMNLVEPFRWSEDFGQFTERWTGVFAGIGSGVHHAALHNPDYDFPDELIPSGIDFWKNLVMQLAI